MILKADAVVGEQAVVAHLEDASSRNGVVVSPCWLYFIADWALLIPEAFKVAHGLHSVFHKAFDILLETCVFFIFDNGFSCSFSGRGSWLVKIDFGSLPVLSVLELSSEEFVIDELLWSTWFDDHGPEMIKHDVVYQRYTDRNPDQSEEHAQSSLEHLSNDSKIAIDMEDYDKVCDDNQDLTQ